MKQRWSPQELDGFWFLSDDELALLRSINLNNRLGFAVQLKFLEHEGRFPRQPVRSPPLSLSLSPTSSPFRHPR